MGCRLFLLVILVTVNMLLSEGGGTVARAALAGPLSLSHMATRQFRAKLKGIILMLCACVCAYPFLD